MDKRGMAMVDTDHFIKHVFELIDADDQELIAMLVSIKTLMKIDGIGNLDELDNDTRDAANLFLNDIKEGMKDSGFIGGADHED